MLLWLKYFSLICGLTWNKLSNFMIQKLTEFNNKHISTRTIEKTNLNIQRPNKDMEEEEEEFLCVLQ